MSRWRKYGTWAILSNRRRLGVDAMAECYREKAGDGRREQRCRDPRQGGSMRIGTRPSHRRHRRARISPTCDAANAEPCGHEARAAQR